jgi:hypothetical protein
VSGVTGTAAMGIAAMRRLAPLAAGVLAVVGLVVLGLDPDLVVQDRRKAARPQFAAAAGSPVAVGPMAQSSSPQPVERPFHLSRAGAHSFNSRTACNS